MMPSAAVSAAGSQDLAALHAQDEQHALALAWMPGGQRLGRRQIGVDLGGQLCGLVVGAERLADDPDLFEDAVVVEGFGHRDEGHARLLQHVDRFLAGRCPRARGCRSD